ncbi:hypothetical protein [Butyrivibrio sp. AE2015]|nr:hypothetical protein [Butyrivibrio sp. AE2015]
MSEAELLGKAKDNRKKCDPKGKTYWSNEKVNSTLPMKNGLFCDFEE